MQHRPVRPPELFDSRPSGFEQMIVSDGDLRTIHLSGQVAWNADRVLEGPDDLYRQTVVSLRNIETALAHAGATLGDVLSLRLYIKDSHIDDGDAVSRALKAVFDGRLPCTTWIGVPRLAHEDFLIEIEPAPVVIPVPSGPGPE